MTIKNGDLPASPSGVMQDGMNAGSHPLNTGFTKREMFAMAAMQGFCSDQSVQIELIAKHAVIVADQLLAELERTK